MKKWTSFVLAFLMMFSLVGCGGEDAAEKNEDVEIELSEMMVEALELTEKEDLDDLIDTEKIKSFEIKEENDEKTAYIVMSQEDHAELLKVIEEEVKDVFTEIEEMEELEYVKKIEADQGYKEVTVTVDEEGFRAAADELGLDFDISMALIGGGTSIYQSFANEDIKSTIIYMNEDGEEISKTIYPDDILDLNAAD